MASARASVFGRVSEACGEVGCAWVNAGLIDHFLTRGAAVVWWVDKNLPESNRVLPGGFGERKFRKYREQSINDNNDRF